MEDEMRTHMKTAANLCREHGHLDCEKAINDAIERLEAEPAHETHRKHKKRDE
jgi:hypothetical protein